jgi:putative tricarboxylic transport membrane protein
MGPLEMFAIAVWGMLLLGALAGRSVWRGLLAGVFGVLLGTVGMNTAGYMRGTMGVPWLLDGIPTIPAMMGLLAASQLLNLINTHYLIEDEADRKISFARILEGVKMTFAYPTIIFRGAAIGVIVGSIPGVGSSISNLISYAETRRNAPDSETFGQGNPKGVIAAEAANSSSEGGAMATMLALGIPGGGATAILLAAFAMHNVIGGPSYIANNKDVVYAIIFSNFAQAVLLLFVGLGFVYIASAVVRVPLRHGALQLSGGRDGRRAAARPAAGGEPAAHLADQPRRRELRAGAPGRRPDLRADVPVDRPDRIVALAAQAGEGRRLHHRGNRLLRPERRG